MIGCQLPDPEFNFHFPYFGSALYENFTRILLNYSDECKGSVIWNDLLEEVLV